LPQRPVRETDVSKALADGELIIDGDPKVAEAFFGYFDPQVRSVSPTREGA